MNRTTISTLLLVTLFCLKSYATIFIVNNTGDSSSMGSGTFRRAIIDVNNDIFPPHNIVFNIATPFPVLNPATTPYPAIGRTTDVNGTNTGVGGGIVTINGANVTAGAIGLTLTAFAGSSTIRNFSIINFNNQAIQINVNNATISNNRIGVDATGTIAGPNGTGIQVPNPAANLTITNNIISGNRTNGINWLSTGATSTIQQNLIGVDITGTIAIPNSNGISAATGSNLIIINNTISGNRGFGITSTAPNSFNISANRIGTDSSGLFAVSNGTGILITNFTALNTRAITNNIISGNAINGINLNNADNITISLNRVGVSAADDFLGNENIGISLTNGSINNTIGSLTSGQGNIIANNPGGGVRVDGATTIRNAIIGNNIFNNNNAGIVLVNNGNSNQQPPILDSICYSGTTLTIHGTAPAIAPLGTELRIQFFANDAANKTNEGQIYLGDSTPVLPGPFTAMLTGITMLPFSPTYISATAVANNNTGSSPGDTSTFSASLSPLALSITPAFQSVCVGDDITLTAITTNPDGTTLYAWTGPNGFMENTGTNPNLTITNATAANSGNYTVSTNSPFFSCPQTSSPAEVAVAVPCTFNTVNN